LASNVAKKCCKYPFCPNLHNNKNGYCDEHQIKYDTNNTSEEDKKYDSYGMYDYQWKEFSKRFLKRHPVCVKCGAKAEVTDHIIPAPIMKYLYGGNTWNEADYQPLCKKCNDLKGKREDREQLEKFFKNKKEKKRVKKVRV